MPVSSGGGGGGGDDPERRPPTAGDNNRDAVPLGGPDRDPMAMVSPELNPSMRELNTASGPAADREPDPDSNLAAGAAQGASRRTEPIVASPDRREFPGGGSKTGVIMGTQTRGPGDRRRTDRLVYSARGEGRADCSAGRRLRRRRIRRSSAFSRTTISSSC